MINIGFVGAGNMGFAIIKGIFESGLCNNKTNTEIKLFAFDFDKERLLNLTKYGVTSCEDAQEIVRKCKFVFLAVKPQQLEEVLDEIKECVTDDTVLVSICAGISDDFIKAHTIPNAKCVLVMPNTPLLLGEGATALAKALPTTDTEFEIVCNIFSACGEIAVLEKNKMREIIAINSSSPAFIYLYAKAFIDYAKSVDINEDTAKKLFCKTLIGASKMITDSGNSIDDLISMVSSKGGTTVAGLEQLYNNNLEGTVKKACEACTKRAYELSK